MAGARSLADLILYIVDQLNDMGRLPSTIQLVKYLYLVDLEHVRSLRRPLTGLQWVYHLYGPYAYDIPRAAASLGFDLQDERFKAEGGEGRLFEAQREGAFPSEFGAASKSVVDRVLQTWGLASTREILDYVYFDTEPLAGAKRGERLRFDNVGPDIGAYEVDVRDSKKLRELRGKYSSVPSSAARTRKKLSTLPDELLDEALSQLEQD